jgi:hypothetical protein
LKSISFESDNSLWSSLIKLKFWTEIKDIYLMCLLKSQGVWSCWKRVVSHFVFKSQFEVTSRKAARSLILWSWWAEILRDNSRRSFTCFSKISKGFKVICEQCSFAKLLWQKFTLRRHQNKFLKWNKYNLGELERSLKIKKRKYIIKTFIRKFGM